MSKIENLVLITSVINIINNPLSYSKIRSVYSKEERFEQTIKTIESIRKYIPNSKILFIECSELDNLTETLIKEKTDYYINLFYLNNLKQTTSSISKSLGEGSMTIEALKYLKNLGIKYDNFYKISGRYRLTDKFKYNEFDNKYNIIKKIEGNTKNISTCFFKIRYEYIDKLLNFLEENIYNMIRCIGYEVLFGLFFKNINWENTKSLDLINIEGNVSVCGSYYYG